MLTLKLLLNEFSTNRTWIWGIHIFTLDMIDSEVDKCVLHFEQPYIDDVLSR